MTEQEQQIAIAEACGWKREPLYDDVANGRNAWRHLDMRVKYTKDLPDYLNDLNAMHEAETRLIGSKESTYRIALEKIVMAQEAKPMTFDFAMIYATAAQRAEAFLRAIEKWKDV